MSIKRANIKLFDKLSERKKWKYFSKVSFCSGVYLSSYNYRELELFNPELSTRLSQVRSFGFINHWNNKIVPFSHFRNREVLTQFLLNYIGSFWECVVS